MPRGVGSWQIAKKYTIDISLIYPMPHFLNHQNLCQGRTSFPEVFQDKKSGNKMIKSQLHLFLREVLAC